MIPIRSDVRVTNYAKAAKREKTLHLSCLC